MQFEETPGGTSRLRRVMAWSLIAFLGVGAGVVTMAATMPLGTAARLAGVEMPVDTVLSGTVLNGAVGLRGHQGHWQTRKWDSVTALSWVADVRMTGPETDVAGQVRLRPALGELADVRGRAGWTLIDAFMPGLEIRCDTTANFDVRQVMVSASARSAEGQVQLAGGSCDRVDGTVTGVPLPALSGVLATTGEGVQLTIAGVDAPDMALGNLLLTIDDRLRITVHPAGATLVPGLPVSGDSQVELPLALFSQ